MSRSQRPHAKQGSVWKILTTALVCLSIGAAASWGAYTVLRPAEAPIDTVTYTKAKVITGEVAAELKLNVVAKWSATPLGVNRASGVVTSRNVSSGDTITQGTTLYTVNMRPVVAAQGSVPAYRDIEYGLSGPDVKQLQQLLYDLGFYWVEPDGEALSGTTTAIRQWQKSLGLETTGVVSPADIVFLPTLPARITLDTEALDIGAEIEPGAKVVSVLPSSPQFTIPVTASQAAMIPADTAVFVNAPDGTEWQGVIAGQHVDDETQQIIYTISGQEGAALCGEACGEIPVSSEVRLPAKIVLVPPTSGLVVPSSALVTNPDGSIVIIDSTGAPHKVTVVASARGQSVIEGVKAGMQVRVPGHNGAEAARTETPSQ